MRLEVAQKDKMLAHRGEKRESVGHPKRCVKDA